MPSLELDLLPSSKDPDEFFDQKEEQIQRASNFFPNLWSPKYSSKFDSLIRQSIQYGLEEIRNQLEKPSGKEVVIKLIRVNKEYVHLRGDYRYDSFEMAKFLVETDYDLLPPYVGISNYGYHLLDGHHRWRAYEMAGLAPLVLTIEVQNGDSFSPKLICQYDESVKTKLVLDEEKHKEFLSFVQNPTQKMSLKELKQLIRRFLI